MEKIAVTAVYLSVFGPGSKGPLKYPPGTDLVFATLDHEQRRKAEAAARAAKAGAALDAHAPPPEVKGDLTAEPPPPGGWPTEEDF